MIATYDLRFVEGYEKAAQDVSRRGYQPVGELQDVEVVLETLGCGESENDEVPSTGCQLQCESLQFLLNLQQEVNQRTDGLSTGYKGKGCKLTSAKKGDEVGQENGA